MYGIVLKLRGRIKIMDNVLTQFSIYKIDYDNFSDIEGMDSSKDEFPIKVKNMIMVKIRKTISERKGAEHWEITRENISGIIYRTIHQPIWKEMAIELLGKENITDEKALNNVNVSYVLFYISDKKLYAMTGGYGSILIKGLIEKNWGLYLIPKLLKEDAGVVREVKENTLYGNTLSMSRANRNVTDFSKEKELSAVFRELCLEVDVTTAESVGLDREKLSKNRKTGIIFKDSLNIRKAISINELTAVIDKLANLEKEPDQFTLSYFVSVKKVGISKSQLFDLLEERFFQKNYENFQLIGEDFNEYAIDSAEYLIHYEKGKEYRTDEQIRLADIFENLFGEMRFSRTLVKRMLKNWTLETCDDAGQTIMSPQKIGQCLQGYLYYEPKKIMCYLIRGDWYCFDVKYLEVLNTQFANIYDKNKKREEELKEKYRLKSQTKTEDEYNKSFYKRKEIIVGHKAMIKNYEIADIFFWDDENLYLMCNKGKFAGEDSRDLTNQIYASAYYMQKMLMSSQRSEFLKQLYESIEATYTREKEQLGKTFDEFSELFTKKVCYVAGYLFGYRKESDSYYAKYLTIDLVKKIQKMGNDCLIMNVEGKK